MISRWKGLIPMIGLLGVVSGCDLGLTGININPNNPEKVPVESLLSGGIWTLVSNSAGRGVMGEWTTLYHTTIWSQHLAQSAYNDEDRYTPRAGLNESIWTEMYAGTLADLDDAQRLGKEADDANLVAVTDILEVYGFLFLTDLFGDVPYFDALDLEQNREPRFTPQAEIYPDLLTRLEEAVRQIDPAGNPSWARSDLIYGGDLLKWRKFANSLRLRIAIRISGTSAAALAGQAFADAWADTPITTNADNAVLRWSGVLPSQNPIFEAFTLGGRGNDFRMSRTLVDILAGRADPRLEIFAAPTVNGSLFRGLSNGDLPADLGLGVNDFSTLGPVFTAASAPSVLMTRAEVLLLGAEAATLGWIPDDAGTLYRAGITAAMENNGVPAAAIESYLAIPGNAYSGVASIQLQKWIALFLNGPESFAEVRRTGVPALPLPAKAALAQLPSRMPYPVREALYNRYAKDYVNTPLDTPMWWMPQ
ncbi:MAG: SusD/RagB family nutrient-binding outer membrane lipoprotein [Gemmatimonadota bacterium]|jgi:hypothetical protein|nr:SusD/RagB family nutrient-binding outer membrane lipoprotein [Gemmatimonadota bacterium]